MTHIIPHGTHKSITYTVQNLYISKMSYSVIFCRAPNTCLVSAAHAHAQFSTLILHRLRHILLWKSKSISTPTSTYISISISLYISMFLSTYMSTGIYLCKSILVHRGMLKDLHRLHAFIYWHIDYHHILARLKISLVAHTATHISAEISTVWALFCWHRLD